jgi:hypothetical protein
LNGGDIQTVQWYHDIQESWMSAWVIAKN